MQQHTVVYARRATEQHSGMCRDMLPGDDLAERTVCSTNGNSSVLPECEAFSDDFMDYPFSA